MGCIRCLVAYGHFVRGNCFPTTLWSPLWPLGNQQPVLPDPKVTQHVVRKNTANTALDGSRIEITLEPQSSELFEEGLKSLGLDTLAKPSITFL